LLLCRRYVLPQWHPQAEALPHPRWEARPRRRQGRVGARVAGLISRASPQDGKFNLFTYRVRGISALPIYVNPNITFGPATEGSPEAGSVGRINVMVGTKQTDGKQVEDVVVRMPLPAHTSSATFSANVGTAIYDEKAKECIWNIGRMPKEASPSLSGSVTLAPGRTGRDLSISLFATFKVAMYASSGLKVAHLRLEREDYQPYKGVRSITKAGRVEIRT